MSLFENFPYTNLHELNLDWLIEYMKQIEAEVQDGPVVSVNNQTGVVTLYQEAQVQLPDIVDSQQTYWNIFRYLNGHIYGIRFDSNGNVYAIRDGIRTKLLTWADIPADAGVISVNGLYGVVHLSGTDIPWMGGENETVFDKLSDNEDAIDELTITLGTLSNAIKAGIAYLEPNVDDTAIHNIPANSYVFWKNYAYKSTQAISIGDTLSSTNLQAVGDGGFINDLKIQIDTLYSKVDTILRQTTGPLFETGVYYCVLPQTIDGVTIPAYSIYSCHVYNTDGVGIVIDTQNAQAWSIKGANNVWNKCEELSLASKTPIIVDGTITTNNGQGQILVNNQEIRTNKFISAYIADLQADRRLILHTYNNLLFGTVTTSTGVLIATDGTFNLKVVKFP